MFELQPFLADADHIDVKVVEGDVTLREFLAGLFQCHSPFPSSGGGKDGAVWGSLSSVGDCLKLRHLSQKTTSFRRGKIESGAVLSPLIFNGGCGDGTKCVF